MKNYRIWSRGCRRAIGCSVPRPVEDEKWHEKREKTRRPLLIGTRFITHVAGTAHVDGRYRVIVSQTRHHRDESNHQEPSKYNFQF